MVTHCMNRCFCSSRQSIFSWSNMLTGTLYWSGTTGVFHELDEASYRVTPRTVNISTIPPFRRANLPSFDNSLKAGNWKRDIWRWKIPLRLSSKWDRFNRKKRLKCTFLLILTSLLMVISIIFMISVGVLLFFMNDSLCFPLSRVSFIPLNASRTWTGTFTRVMIISGSAERVINLHYRVPSTRQYSAGSSTCLLDGYHPAMEILHYHPSPFTQRIGNKKKRIPRGFWYFFYTYSDKPVKTGYPSDFGHFLKYKLFLVRSPSLHPSSPPYILLSISIAEDSSQIRGSIQFIIDRSIQIILESLIEFVLDVTRPELRQTIRSSCRD